MIDLARLAQWSVCLTVPQRWPTHLQLVRRQLGARGIEVTGLYNSREPLPVLPPDVLGLQIEGEPPTSWQCKPGAWRMWTATRAMIGAAKEAGYDSVLLLEDDLLLTDQFDRIVEQADIPADWELIYFGGWHMRSERLSPHLLRVFGTLCTQMVLIRSTVFDTILNFKPDLPFDNALMDHIQPRGKSYSLWPSVAVQMPGRSTIQDGEMGGWASLFDKSGVPGENA